MQHINLLDPRLLPVRHLLSGRRLATLAALGLVLAGTHLAIEQRRLSAAMAAAGLTAEPVDAVDETQPDASLSARIVQRQALLDMLSKADELPRNSADTLRSVIAALPETVWLTEVDMVGRDGVRIAGGAIDPPSLRTFADRLSRIEPLRGVPIETLRLDPDVADDAEAVAAPPRLRFVLASASHTAAEGTR
jgi:Tfp pilus assembly protein PilN